MDAVRFCRKLLGDKANKLPAQTSASFATRWSEIIEGTDRRWALHGFEAAALFEMRKALRNGSPWIDHSFSFRCRDEIMLPAREWESQRSRLTAQLGASSSPRPLIERLTANIDASLAAFDEAGRAGELWVDERGIHIPPVRAEVRPDTVERVARELFGAIGTVQLPELMVDIDRETHFSWALLGREPTNEAEIRAVYAGLLAQGTELSALGVSLMVPAVAEHLPADMIVMGTLGRTGLAHIFVGSVAERTIRLASCPVTTVRPYPRRRLAGPSGRATLTQCFSRPGHGRFPRRATPGSAPRRWPRPRHPPPDREAKTLVLRSSREAIESLASALRLTRLGAPNAVRTRGDGFNHPFRLVRVADVD